ncbi:MAG: type II secretion system protein [Betaproteobacteria bacterium]|nr:type II secretion system protein [Betaproteobacteria bacterium]
MHASKQSGFTLIELIVVIVILGILASVALPRFVDLQGEARRSVINSTSGSIQAANAMIYGKALVDGVASLPTSSIDIGGGVKVATAYGYPDATTAGIGAALESAAGLSALYSLNPDGTATFLVNGARRPHQCQVAYTPPARASGRPSVKTATAGC